MWYLGRRKKEPAQATSNISLRRCFLARRHTLLEVVRPEAIAKIAEAFGWQSFASIQAEQRFNRRGDVIIAHALAER
jgi:hypothetical protein